MLLKFPYLLNRDIRINLFTLKSVPVCKVDVGILMDESGSVSKDDFERQKSFVKALAGHFQFGSDGAQFGVITFSSGAQLDITLNRYGDTASFGEGVNRIRHGGIAYFFHHSGQF